MVTEKEMVSGTVSRRLAPISKRGVGWSHSLFHLMVPPSLLVSSQGRGLIDLPLRASNECLFIWSILSIWFVWLIGLEIHSEEPDRPERPANQTDEPERVARAQETV